MRVQRVLIAPVLAAVFFSVTAAPLLPTAGGGLMPCCEGGNPCDTALQATGCCRVDAASDRAPGLAVTRNAGSSKPRPALAPAPVASAASTSAPVRIMLLRAGDSPPHAAGRPLYLLNGTLLR
jgi:hypothetical protein